MLTVVVISVVVTVVVTVFTKRCCAEVVVAFWVVLDFVKLGKTNALLLVESGEAVTVPFEPVPPVVPFPPPGEDGELEAGTAPELELDTTGPPDVIVLEPDADMLPKLMEDNIPLGTGTLPFVPGSPPPAIPVKRIAACAYALLSRLLALLLSRQFGLTPSV